MRSSARATMLKVDVCSLREEPTFYADFLFECGGAAAVSLHPQGARCLPVRGALLVSRKNAQSACGKRPGVLRTTILNGGLRRLSNITVAEHFCVASAHEATSDTLYISPRQILLSAKIAGPSRFFFLFRIFYF